MGQCALASGAVYCWGGNIFGEMGLGTIGGKYFPPEPVYTGGALAGRSITSLAVGDRQTYITTAEQPAAVVTPGAFTPLTASRLLDTRPEGILANGSLGLQVLGRAGVPTSNVSAVVANVTAVASTAGGYLSVSRDGDRKPPTSTLNFPARKVVANLATIPVGTDGKIRIYNGSPGLTPVLVDVTGYYVGGTATTPGSYVNLPPSRLVDTRPEGVYPNSAVTLTHVFIPGVPATGAVAINANLTAVPNGTAGNLRLSYTNQGGFPALAFGAHDVVANMVCLTFDESSSFAIVNKLNDTNSQSRTSALLDVNGYFNAGAPYAPGTFSPIRPTNISASPTVAIAGTASLSLPVTGVGGIPPRAVGSVVVHLTVTGPSAPGYVSLSADGAARPTTSVLNFAPQQAVSNTAIVPVGADGKIRVYNNSRAGIEVQATVTGYYRTGGI